MANQYEYDFATPSSGGSATPATTPTNSFWNSLASITPSWFPQVVNPTAQRLQQEQEARLRELQQRQIEQEQQIATLQATGQYPINTGETAQGKPPVYYDPQTGRTSTSKAGDPNRITQPDTNLAETTPNVEPFTFNYANEQDTAYKALENFYSKLLDFSNGKIDIAKRTLEYIYQQGNREAIQEHEQAIAEQQIKFPQETQELTTNLNKRGMYFSGFGNEDKTSLQKSQDVRRLAVERAKENRLSRLQTERDLDLEKTNLSGEEEKFNLERQRRQEAKGMAQDEYTIKSAKYNSQLDKQLQEEARASNKIANNAVLGALSGGAKSTATAGTSGFSTGDTNRFRSWMQTTGRQQELDKATAGSTQQGSDFYALMTKYRGMF